MSETIRKLERPPIVEAVIDLDCDSPAGQDLAGLEAAAREAFRDRYPKLKTQFLQEFIVAAPASDSPSHSTRRGLQAFQFLDADERQLVQVRRAGFSFNRLAPYSSLDDYLPEIERAWRLFVDLAKPIRVRQVRLRYINRILLPLASGDVDLDDYLATGPRIPEEKTLRFVDFLHRHVAGDISTGHRVNTILASERPVDDHLPVVLDIEAVADAHIDPQDWQAIAALVAELRDLKNVVFRRSLTEKCLELF